MPTMIVPAAEITSQLLWRDKCWCSGRFLATGKSSSWCPVIANFELRRQFTSHVVDYFLSLADSVVGIKSRRQDDFESFRSATSLPLYSKGGDHMCFVQVLRRDLKGVIVYVAIVIRPTAISAGLTFSSLRFQA